MKPTIITSGNYCSADYVIVSEHAEISVNKLVTGYMCSSDKEMQEEFLTNYKHNPNYRKAALFKQVRM